MKLRVALALAVVSVAFVACADKDVEPPKALVTFSPHRDVTKLWSLSVGDKDRKLRLALVPTVVDGRLYAAGHGGAVYAVDAKTGKVYWHTNTKLPLSGGPGVGSGLVVAGAIDGQVVALDAKTGAKRWQVRTSGEVLAAPAVAANAVIVRTVDGRVRALALDTGKELWLNEEQVPRLSLRGTAPPVLAGDAVVCGFDDGKVAAYALANGDRLWEATVGTSHGKTEIERLVDIDGAVRVSGRDLFVVGFQGKLSMLALDSGQVWWSRDLSSHKGLALGEETIYVATSDGQVQALRRRDGSVIWTNDDLLRRQLTAPAIDGDTIVVADYLGYLHWIDRESGKMIARVHTKKGSVTNGPIVDDGVVYLEVDAGNVYAVALKDGLRGAPAAAKAPTTPAKTVVPKGKPGNLPADLSPTGQ